MTFEILGELSGFAALATHEEDLLRASTHLRHLVERLVIVTLAALLVLD
jgi:hypothetical protein